MKKFTKLFLLDVPGLVLALAAVSCSGTTRRPVQARPVHEAPGAQGAPAVVVAVAGDIACDPRDRNYNGGLGSTTRCHMQATSDLLFSLHPDVVLTMGDDQYLRGGLDAFLQSYDRTWGHFRSITHPTPGNHEYWTADAAGYFAYFGKLAGPVGKGYYSYNLGTWHVIALNSNCRHIGRCGFGSPEERWLRADLRAHPGSCILAYWHHPRFSSGIHGSNRAYLPFWHDLYEAGADVVLAGHDHHYERFAPQEPEGEPDPQRGISEFVAGTGGKGGYSGFYRFIPLRRYHNPNSEVRKSGTSGCWRIHEARESPSSAPS